MRRLRMTIQYDGSAFYGWQCQPELRTVQRVLRELLEKITQDRVSLVAAGRTDRGVHALGQVAHFNTSSPLPVSTFRQALQALTPEDIAITDLEEASLKFHARYSAQRRVYLYLIGQTDRARSPFLNRYCWPLPDHLDRDLLEACLRLLPGEHDFSLFCKGRPKNPRCHVFEATWEQVSIGLAFRVTGDRFLRRMVRLLVSTMVAVARGRLSQEAFGAMLEAEGERPPIRSAPPQGLFLCSVEY